MLNLIHKLETKILTDIHQTVQKVEPKVQQRIYNLKRDSEVREIKKVKYSHEHHAYVDKDGNKYMLDLDQDYY